IKSAVEKSTDDCDVVNLGRKARGLDVKIKCILRDGRQQSPMIRRFKQPKKEIVVLLRKRADGIVQTFQPSQAPRVGCGRRLIVKQTLLCSTLKEVARRQS